jgi:sugar transferase (PEP-CTERM system associated)
MFAPHAVTNRCIILIVGDFLVATLAAYAAFAIVSLSGPVIGAHHNVVSLALVFGLLCVIANNFQDLYAIEQPSSGGQIVAALLMAAVKLCCIVAIAMLSNDRLLLGRRVYVTYVGIATILLIVWRLAVNAAAAGRVSNGVMILGDGKLTRMIVREIEQRSHLGYKCLGFVHGARRQRAVGDTFSSQGDTTYLASSLSSLFVNGRANSLVVDANEHPKCPPQELMKWRVRGVEILDCESFYERITGKLPVSDLRETWLLFAPGFMRQKWRLLVKRFVDIVTAMVLMICSFPIAALTAMAIKLDSAGPLFYSQNRVGLQGQVFRIWKFRSMRSDAEQPTGATWAAIGDPRVTRVGRIIRRLRIDELPQLLNVLMGDMSLIGPRPERPEITADLNRSLPLYDYRHSVRPGLTGWAQVCYPYGATVEDAKEKLCYDLYYIKNWSLTFDLQIMLQTVKVVLYGRGAR